MSIGDALLSPEFLRLLAAEDPDLGHMRRVVVEAYNSEEGQSLDAEDLRGEDRAP